MSVTRLSHNKFQIRIYSGRDPFTKKRINETCTFCGTEEQAHRLEKRMKAKVKAKKLANPSRMRLNDLFDLYLEDARPRVAPRTYHDLEKILSRWVRPMIGEVHLKTLTPKILKSFFEYLSAPKKVATKKEEK